jgi:hypothetical protein
MSSPHDEARGRTLRTMRLVPARKLPQLPPKGERFFGLLRPATLIWFAVAAVLVAVVAIGVGTSRSDAPTTLEGVTEEVTAEVSTLLDLLPVPVQEVSDDSLLQACPDGSAEQQYALERVVTATGADVGSAEEWAQTVRAAYEERGWRVLTESIGGKGVGISLVGTNLVPLNVSVRPAVEPAGLRITLRSESRCTDTGANG